LPPVRNEQFTYCLTTLDLVATELAAGT